MTGDLAITELPLVWRHLQTRRRVALWTGVAMAGLGAVAIIWPWAAPLAIGAFAGWLLWFAGAVMLGAALLLLRGRSLTSGLISSLATIAAGVFLLMRPEAGALAVTLLATAVFVVEGAFQLALALDLRPVRVWRWVLASALSSAVAALLLASGGAADSTANFGALLGLALSSTGLAFLILGCSDRAPDRDRRRSRTK